MFSLNHFIWLGICAILSALALTYLNKRKPSLKEVLTVACWLSLLSEFVKTMSVLELIPSSDGSSLHLYMKMQHLPFHLCSIQIIFIFITRFTQNEKVKEILLAFMYPACVLGGILAMLIPSIFSSGSVPVAEAFSKPLAYQFFLFHVMLLVLGIYIVMSKEIKLTWKHYFTTLAIVFMMAFGSIYLNSIFAIPTYVDGKLISVDYSTNFFFTQRTPIGIDLVTKGQWYLYLLILVALAFIFVGILYFIALKRGDKHA